MPDEVTDLQREEVDELDVGEDEEEPQQPGEGQQVASGDASALPVIEQQDNLREGKAACRLHTIVAAGAQKTSRWTAGITSLRRSLKKLL